MIGITGGIGAGKSVISRILRLRGFGVYDCDYEARRLMEENAGIREVLTCRYGQDLYAGGILCRPMLAGKIFGDEKERLFVNSVVHGAVREDVRRWYACDPERNIYVESAILFESGLADDCREIWIVTAPPEVRLRRAMARDPHADEADLRRRIEAQRREERERSAESGERRGCPCRPVGTRLIASGQPRIKYIENYKTPIL